MFYRFEPCSDLSNETKHFDFGLIFWHVLTHSHGVGPTSIGLTLVREGGCTCNTTPRHFGPLSCMSPILANCIAQCSCPNDEQWLIFLNMVLIIDEIWFLKNQAFYQGIHIDIQAAISPIHLKMSEFSSLWNTNESIHPTCA